MSALLSAFAALVGIDDAVLGALAPLGVLFGYLTLALPIYLWRRRRRGAYRDGEVEGRGSSFLLAMPVRVFFVWAVQPLWRLLCWSGIPPAAITTLSGLLSLGAGVAAAAGQLSLGGWLVLGAGLCDFFDGRLARASRRASPRGAALDSVVDRYSDAAVLAGLAWYYRGSTVLLAALLALVGSLLVSYVRARAEGLGADARAGLMQRPERVVILGVTMAFSPLESLLHELDGPPATYWIAVAGLVVVAVGSQLTAFARFARLLRSLGATPGGGGPTEPVTPPLVGGAIASATGATAVDFLVVVALVELVGLPAWVATPIGCLLGGITNFTVNRRWVFRALDAPVPQAGRYALTSATSALLNAGGVALLLLLPSFDYRLAWALVRAAVFVCWNFPLQRSYVYAPPSPAGPEAKSVPAPQATPAPSSPLGPELPGAATLRPSLVAQKLD